MVEPKKPAKEKILCLNFNQDQTCFACGTEKGYHIYNSYPFENTIHKDLGHRIIIIEMLYRSNILALVGNDDDDPKWNNHKIVLWDDHESKSVGELTFKSVIKGVKLRKDKIGIITEARIYLYNISDFKMIDAIDTCNNPNGICSISKKDNVIIVCPSTTKGHIHIINYENNSSIDVQAHESDLSAIEISPDSKLCATASYKGTLIRVFSIDEGNLLQELRRGSGKARIHCISFHPNMKWLTCSSDKKTVHVFSLFDAGHAVTTAIPMSSSAPLTGTEKKEEDKKAVDPKNPKSVFKFMKGIVPYFKSEWSFAQLRLSEGDTTVSFAPDNSNAIIGIKYNKHI